VIKYSTAVLAPTRFLQADLGRELRTLDAAETVACPNSTSTVCATLTAMLHHGCVTPGSAAMTS
jgi:hypothetical protein